MKKMFCIFITLLLVLLAVSTVFAGGGGQAQSSAPAAAGRYQRDPNLNAPGTFPINKTRVPLKIGVPQVPTVEDWETNWMTVQLETRGNYDLTFELYPVAEFDQKVQLMMMAGGDELPDVLWTNGNFNLGRLVTYGEAGLVLPLYIYYQNSAYYINEGLKEAEIDIMKYITSYDGNVYGFPGILEYVSGEYSSNYLYFFAPWLKKLGLSVPGTITELENVLKAFKERDPNGNGIQDEIPMVSDSSYSLSNMLIALMNPFIYTQTDYWILDNGKIDVAFNKPQWREGLRYVKSLLDQGLISPLSYTQNATQMTAMTIAEPWTVGAFARISGTHLPAGSEIRLGFADGFGLPLAGPGRTNAFRNPILPTVKMIITKNCKTPESAFMLGDFMCTEEMSIANRYGEKGVDWLVPGPEYRGFTESMGYPPTMVTANVPGGAVYGTVHNKYYYSTGPHIISGKWGNGGSYLASEGDRDTGSNMLPYVKAADPNPIVGLIYNEQEQQVMNQYHSTIINYVHESYVRFVMSDLSIDSDWDRYVAEFNRMGLADVIRVTQSCYDRMNK